MSNKNILRGLLISTALSMSMCSHAVIIEGTFGGIVSEAQDGNDFDSSYVDIWKGNLVGKSVTGSFWYDTDLAPGNTANPNTPNEAIYFKRSNWLGITFNIDGKVFDISNDNPYSLRASYIVDVVTIDNHVLATNGDNQENFMVSDSVERGTEGGNYELREGMVAFSDSLIDVMDGIGLVQEFEWTNHNEWPFAGTGYFSFFSSINGQLSFANASMNISDIHAKVRNQVSIPEPSTVMLMAIGLLSLALRRVRASAK
jgi:hypothetical protein